MLGLTDIRDGASQKYVGGTNQATKICNNLDFVKEVWYGKLLPENFGINLVLSGVYSGGFFVEIGTYYEVKIGY